MFHTKPPRGAALCADTAPLFLPAPDSAPNLPRALGSWDDEKLTEIAQETVALEPAWSLNHTADDIQQIEAEQGDSEQTPDEWTIETPTIGPARTWVKSLAIWAPGGSRTVRQRNAKSARNARAGATGTTLAMHPGGPPEKRGLVLVTAELIGDPKPNYVRAELRQDEGGSAPAGPDDQVWMEVAPRWRSPPAIAAITTDANL